MFGRIAPTYDLLNRVLSAGFDVRWRRRAVRALGAAPGARVLDLCAGTLDLALELRRRRPDVRAVCADFALPMLARGRRKPGAASLACAGADALHLPFRPAGFDAAMIAFGMRNLDDPRAGLAELRRVLRPGAPLVVLEFFRPVSRGARLLHGVFNRAVLPAVGGAVSGDGGAYRYLPRSIEAFLSRSEFEACAVEAGFAQVLGEDLAPGIASIVRAVA